jgi:hypothetical protein
MIQAYKKAFAVLTLAVLLTLNVSNLRAATPGITLIGKGSVSGMSLDTSGLNGIICQEGNPTNCIPKAILGGFGSALSYTGYYDVFIAAPDRGPFDGLTSVSHRDRVYFFRITTLMRAPFPNIKVELLDTRLLKNQFNQPLVGATAALNFSFDPAFPPLRFDPEGIRVGPAGTYYISDEYGPYIYEFDRLGRLLRRIAVPSKFSIANPSADPNLELLGNTAGRQANRGMEGLAISPDGTTLYAIMQNALIQDRGLNPGTTDRLGLNNRIVKINLLTGETNEYVYVLDAINRGQGVSEILAINDHEFLVIERDNRSNLQTPPQAPTRKTIYKINLTGATDVSGIESLPAGALPAGVIPVSKTLFIDLLDSDFNLAGTIAEKIEALAWGPNLPDGRHVLYVVSDNDLNPNLATQLYAFAIDPSLIDYKRQFAPVPTFIP